jgi:hypothetical protein
VERRETAFTGRVNNVNTKSVRRREVTAEENEAGE